MISAYLVDHITVVKANGNDQWGEPNPTTNIATKGYVEWKTNLIRNLAGEEIVSPIHVYLHMRKTDNALGRALVHADRLIVDGRERSIIAIHEPKAFSRPHYEVYLAQDDNMGMTIDMSDFEKGFKKLVEGSVPPEIEKGMFQAANALLKDAIYEQPYAPFDEGHLRASARVEKIKADKEAVELAAGFNIVYAARWHELSPSEDARISWTLPGSGRKYLESKMARNAKRYLNIVGEYLKGLLGG